MKLGTEASDVGWDLTGTTVAVFGLGKIGLPLAAVLAESGAEVLGVDIDESVVDTVNDGRTPVNEPGLADLIGKYGGSEIEATTDGRVAARSASVMIVLVPTILTDDDQPALDPVIDAARTIGDGVESGDLVVLESTVPPGTTGGIFLEAIESTADVSADEFGVAHCPERTSSGQVIEDLTKSYPKIVGGVDAESTATAASFYRTFNEPGVIEMSGAMAAEAVKVFEGAYRDVNIGLANELAVVCEEWGLDSAEVFEAANTQPYCDIHEPGIGVGGHCIPVYPHFVIGRATDTSLLETARSVNDGMPNHAVERLESALVGAGVDLSDARVLILGVTYRAGIDEIRYAPAVDAIAALLDTGADVYAHDPILDDSTIAETGATAARAPTAIDDLDAVLLATGHESYHDVDLGVLRSRMRTPVLIDGRAFFDRNEVEGFRYLRIGDGSTGRS